jgi:hypothetical protein
MWGATVTNTQKHRTGFETGQWVEFGRVLGCMLEKFYVVMRGQ